MTLAPNRRVHAQPNSGGQEGDRTPVPPEGVRGAHGGEELGGAGSTASFLDAASRVTRFLRRAYPPSSAPTVAWPMRSLTTLAGIPAGEGSGSVAVAQVVEPNPRKAGGSGLASEQSRESFRVQEGAILTGEDEAGVPIGLPPRPASPPADSCGELVRQRR